MGNQGVLFYIENKPPNTINTGRFDDGKNTMFCINHSNYDSMILDVIKDYNVILYRPKHIFRKMYGGEVSIKFIYNWLTVVINKTVNAFIINESF